MAKKTLELLTESMFYVLMAFSKGPKCGTEIAEFVEHITRKRVTIGPGTLYTILSKFQEEALLKEVAVEGRKRTYAITEKGISCFHEEVIRLKCYWKMQRKREDFIMNYKYNVCMIRLFEYVAFEKYIEDMIRKGWMLDKINNVYLRFRPCTPKEVHVKIGFNLETYAIDPAYETNDTKQYRDFIQEFGYEFQCGYGALQVFTGEKDIALMNEATIDERVLRKAIFKDELSKSIFQLFLFLMLVFTQVYNVQLYMLTSNLFLFSNVITLIFGIFTILRLIPYIRYVCTRKIGVNPKRLEKRFSYIYIIFLLLLLLGFICIATSSMYIVGFLLVIAGASAILCKKKAQMHPYMKILLLVITLYVTLMLCITFMMQNSFSSQSDNATSIVGLTAKDMGGNIGDEPYTRLDESLLILNEEHADDEFSYAYYEVKPTILQQYCMEKVWEEERMSNANMQEVFGVELYERKEDSEHGAKYILKKGNKLISIGEAYDEKRSAIIAKKVFGN